MARAPSQTVIQSRLNLALDVAQERGLIVYGVRIGEGGEVHVITNAPPLTGNEADKWFAEN